MLRNLRHPTGSLDVGFICALKTNETLNPTWFVIRQPIVPEVSPDDIKLLNSRLSQEASQSLDVQSGMLCVRHCSRT